MYTWLVIQVATTWAMTGIIWLVQWVQYPSFSRVAPTSFVDFHAHHSATITFVVAPLMIGETVSAVAFLWVPLDVQTTWQIWSGIALLVVTWGSTFLVQVPLHEKLAGGFDEAAWRSLVTTNWVRTLAWSARAALVTVWLWRALS